MEVVYVKNINKILVAILGFLLFIPNVFALEKDKKYSVDFSNCTDSSSARFILDNNEIKIKFLGIDTLNALNNNQNKEVDKELIDQYVCDKLKSAEKIEIELEKESDEKDKYDRYLAWVFVDDVLIQEDLLEKGYAKTFYLYENYKYYDLLKSKEEEAKTNKVGVWYEEIKEELTITNEEEKKENFFDFLLNFINKIFEKIIEFVDDLIKNVFD